MNTQFLETVFTDGIQHPNFFNGRILTATDLRDEQAANLKRSRYLGQAIGSGVVSGLDVRASSDRRALTITGGLAINRRGDVLRLPGEVTTVELVISKQVTATRPSPFIPCDIAGATTLTGVLSKGGYYLLAIANATRLSKAMAPNSGLNGDRPNCTNRYEEMGVQFKLVPLTPDDFVSSLTPTAKNSRSHLVHRCLGTYELGATPTQTLGASWATQEYGLVDDLYTDGRLTECDVPLAVFQFQPPSLRFVDRWAVRRTPVTAAYPQAYINHPFAQLVSPRRTLEAIAFLLQFQDHLADIQQDSSVNPAEVVAKDYFEFLPAAGYLPIQGRTQPQAFRTTRFFGSELTEQSIAPALVRSLFHESFYLDPIRPGIDAIDLYQVNLNSEVSYRLFARRQQPIILPEPEPDSPEESPRPIATGDLYVTVLDAAGKVVSDDRVQRVQVTHQATGKVYVAQKGKPYRDRPSSLRQYKSFLQTEQARIVAKYVNRIRVNQSSSTIHDFGNDFVALPPKEPSAYAFDNLPAGRYTVLAVPTQKTEVGVSSQVAVRANLSNLATATLRPLGLKRPRDYWIPKDALTPGGIILDGFWVNPKWREVYPGWDRDIFVNPVVNPSPEDWIRFEDTDIQFGLEDVLVNNPANDPGLVMEGSVIYLRRDYLPTQATDTVVAFAQTPDGQRFPVIPLAADNALDKPASVDRTTIPDFDRATVDRLNQVGLSDLEAIASAPTKLVAAVLGQDATYSTSLITDARETLQADFREGYLGYAGITPEQNTRLKAQFGSKVDLANANPAAIAAALAIGTDNRFVSRFLADVKATVPLASYDLGSNGMSASRQEALAGINVASTKDLVQRGKTTEGRTQLQEALGVSEATLGRYLETATLNLARGELIAAPEKSIGTLANVPSELQASLANAGIGSAKELANANPADLATAIGVSLAETQAIVSAAAPFGSKAHLTLVNSATQGTVEAEAIANAGLTSAGAIAKADPSTLANVGLDPSAAQQVKNLTNQLLVSRNFRSFR